MENPNLPKLPDNNSVLRIIPSSDLSLRGDDGFDFEDIKIQFDEQVPFYEKTDFAVSAASGLLTSVINIVLVDKFSLVDAQNWGTNKVNEFVKIVAKKIGYKGDDLKSAIRFIEKKFTIPADAVMSKFGGALQHHLRDFTHHPTIAGLFFSLLTQFTKKVYGTDTDGKFIKEPVPDYLFIGKTIPEKILFGTVHWMLHLISDMAGSSSNDGRGTGIPGPILSFVKEMSALPFFKSIKVNTENDKIALSKWISKLFNGTAIKGVHIDLRTELGILYKGFLQSLPVIANECIVRGYYMISRLCYEIKTRDIKSITDLSKINVCNILPIDNRRLTRMLTISSGVFFTTTTTVAVTKDVISQQYINLIWDLNYIGIVRFVIAIKDDYYYIYEDVNQLQEDIRKRQQDRNKYYTEHESKTAQLWLTPSQVKLLYSLEYQKIQYDISKSRRTKPNKVRWQKEWTKLIQEASNYPLIKDEPELYSALIKEANKCTDRNWIYLLTLELYRFTPYYGLGRNARDDKKYKSLHMTQDYESDVFTVLQSYVDKPVYKKLTNSFQKNRLYLDDPVKKATRTATAAFIVSAATGSFAIPLGILGYGLINTSLISTSGVPFISHTGDILIGILGNGILPISYIRHLSSRGCVVSECASILTFCDMIIKHDKDANNTIMQINKNLENVIKEINADINQMDSVKKANKDKTLIRKLKENIEIIERAQKKLNKMTKTIA